MTDSDIFPRTGEQAAVERHAKAFADVAAYDLDGARYCVECAAEHDEIDRERFRTEPETVPYGGAVRTYHESDHKQTCSQCGATIPMTILLESQ